MVYSVVLDSYLHYKIRVGDLELYNLESQKVSENDITINVFERIGSVDGYLLLYDSKTGLVYLSDKHGNITPYYANSSGKIVSYDRASNSLVY